MFELMVLGQTTVNINEWHIVGIVLFILAVLIAFGNGRQSGIEDYEDNRREYFERSIRQDRPKD